jgi:chorismate synthase
MVRFLTAGESLGRALVVILEGIPAGLSIDIEAITADLRRRQGGYGRGRRMAIESDRAEILSGVRAGETIGGPIAMTIANRDWVNWQYTMRTTPEGPAEGGGARRAAVTKPRPGHADLAGVAKYGRTDVRDVLERASARETAARVAGGGLCQAFLRALGVEIRSHVIQIGSVHAPEREDLTVSDFDGVDESPVRSLDAEATEAMVNEINTARKANESLGGVYDVVAFGLVPGIGSHLAWDERMDGRLAQAVMSIQAMKGASIGDAFDVAGRVGSAAHDEIFFSEERGFYRDTNRAGGLEGGMTTGEPLIVRGAMKPLPTLTKPLRSVDIDTKEPAQALRERTDSCTVPAAAVVAEAMVALVLASAYREKFGGDHIDDAVAALRAYKERIGWTR